MGISWTSTWQDRCFNCNGVWIKWKKRDSVNVGMHPSFLFFIGYRILQCNHNAKNLTILYAKNRICTVFHIGMKYADYICMAVLCPICVLFVSVLCLVSPMLPLSLDCPFLIAPSVFSNVYLKRFKSRRKDNSY